MMNQYFFATINVLQQPAALCISMSVEKFVGFTGCHFDSVMKQTVVESAEEEDKHKEDGP